MKGIDYWIDNLGLQKHPEGGYFKETYRSDEIIEKSALPSRYSGNRAVSTAIYFMVTTDCPSKFHKVNSDEFWFFHDGGRLKIFILHPDGKHEICLFGRNLDNSEHPQIMIPKNTWFAACTHECDYVVLSCTVAPGFDFDDFQLAERKVLLDSYPQHSELILKLS
jgi:uncharacterized protein